MARRTRSEAILRAAGAAVGPWLPTIETANQIEPRSVIEIARRAICLLLVSAKPELDSETLGILIEQHQMAGHFTPDEQTFLDCTTPTEQNIRSFSWRSEASWVLLWALGFVDELGLPTDQRSPWDAIEIVDENGIEGLVSLATPRTMDEILDEADLIYRCHWAIRHRERAWVATGFPLEAGVTFERHQALNWLIRYEGQEWDEISTDT